MKLMCTVSNISESWEHWHKIPTETGLINKLICVGFASCTATWFQCQTKYSVRSLVCADNCIRPNSCKMVLCQGVSVGNAQLLAFPGRSSSLKSTQFHVKTNHFPARALRGMKTANLFSFGSLQFRRTYSFIAIANIVFLNFCLLIFLIEPFLLIIGVLDKISWSCSFLMNWMFLLIPKDLPSNIAHCMPQSKVLS